jgi:alkaline phosphatase
MSSPHSTSRRDFLRVAGLGGVVFGAASASALEATPREAGDNAASAQAKNVIFMVADGMNISALSLTHTYLRRVREQTSRWMGMYRELPVVRSLCETESASSLVTDSAAAASCWGIGERVANGSINVTVDGRRPETLFRKMKAARKRTGLVTTATATHATPAGFVATVSARAKQGLIAPQYLTYGVDVILGGGTQYFDEELLEDYRQAGYVFAGDRTALLAYDGAKPLLGLFDKSYLPFEIDRLHDPVLAARIPTLSEMTTAALRNLDNSPHGFFLLVEGARVDHAAHGNDPAATIQEQVAFDDALGVALAYVERHPETLLIVTTDHGTGGLQLNGLGSEDFLGTLPVYAESTPAFMRTTRFTMSLELMGKLGKAPGVKNFADFVAQKTKLEFKTADRLLIKDIKTLLPILPKYTGIGWTGNNHTSELVEFSAYGPGSALFPAFLRNDEVHALLLKATGVA